MSVLQLAIVRESEIPSRDTWQAAIDRRSGTGGRGGLDLFAQQKRGRRHLLERQRGDGISVFFACLGQSSKGRFEVFFFIDLVLIQQFHQDAAILKIGVHPLAKERHHHMRGIADEHGAVGMPGAQRTVFSDDMGLLTQSLSNVGIGEGFIVANPFKGIIIITIKNISALKKFALENYDNDWIYANRKTWNSNPKECIFILQPKKKWKIYRTIRFMSQMPDLFCQKMSSI